VAAGDASRGLFHNAPDKGQLIKIHSNEGFGGFEETVANPAATMEMLKAVVEMIEGARGRMIASACACLQNYDGLTASMGGPSKVPVK
jgi:hypothetical protein